MTDASPERSGHVSISPLERHETRRAAGVPTISVLAGDSGQGARLCESRLANRRARPIRIDLPNAVSIASAYLECLLAQRVLIDDALDALGRQTGRPIDLLRQEWLRRTRRERSLWLDRLGLNDGPDDRDRLCRTILEAGAAGSASLEWLEWQPARIAAAFGRLILAEEVPALECTWCEHTPGGLSRTAEELFALVTAAPVIPIVLIVASAPLESWLHDGRETRAKAFLRDGLINLSNARGGEPPDEAIPLDHLDSGSASDSDDGLPDDLARSAAERFLFEVLEATPATTCLFALNVKLDFPFGSSRLIEVDLACQRFKLAVEIDGHYHFLDAECYRRDRRKDLELQSRGWLVLRFLAADVGARQEEIVAAIANAVELRRRESTS